MGEKQNNSFTKEKNKEIDNFINSFSILVENKIEASKWSNGKLPSFYGLGAFGKSVRAIATFNDETEKDKVELIVSNKNILEYTIIEGKIQNISINEELFELIDTQDIKNLNDILLKLIAKDEHYIKQHKNKLAKDIKNIHLFIVDSDAENYLRSLAEDFVKWLKN